MKQKIKNFIPSYAFIPLILVVLMNSIVYHGAQLLSKGMIHHSLALKIDSIIPFWPIFILFYVLAFGQWMIGYIIISRENKESCYKILSAELVAKLICFVIFVLFPTTIVRPEITGHSLIDSFMKLIYFCDEPVNLFPSIHCLESYLCFRGSIPLKKVPKWYKWLQFIFSIFVFASTVLIKQHVVLDIIGGIIVAEIGLFIANHFCTEFIFLKIEKLLQRFKTRN